MQEVNLEGFRSIEWIGATNNNNSFTILQSILESEHNFQLVHQENVPFLIREHERKFQYGVSHATIWKLK